MESSNAFGTVTVLWEIILFISYSKRPFDGEEGGDDEDLVGIFVNGEGTLWYFSNYEKQQALQ